MAMSIGGKGQRAEINVTPMIDVLLVLIIIFMVITPLAPTGLNAQVPQAATTQRPAAPLGDIVISVGHDGAIALNQEPLDVPALQARLSAIFRNGPARAVFVRGEKDLEFHQVAEIIDLARGAGATRIGLMTN